MTQKKYHLIFKDEEDQTSNQAIDWLLALKYNVITINNDRFIIDFISSKNGSELLLYNQDVQIKLSSISSYWMRRGNLHLPDFKTIESKSDVDKHKNTYLEGESKTLYHTVMQQIYSKHGIGRIELNETNKLYNIFMAQKTGLIVPLTMVSHQKEFLKKSTNTKHVYCTKAIRQGWHSDGVKAFDGPTCLVKTDDFEKIGNITWPSLLQEYQEKRYELRIFYLDGDFYTSAIFSQNDEQTKVDFRNYNYARPNRTPPYKLPQDIEQKLHNLMKKLDINCGSIDMVVNTKNEFVFLEVNPFGQFQQVSYPCNYYLELKVAEYLTKYDQKEKAIC